MTASTRTVTLSLVMMSCGGTFIVTVCRFTFTIRSIAGMIRNRPGPFAPGRTRPSRKITPRSYSCTTRIALNSRITSRNTMTPMTIRPSMSSLPPLVLGPHQEEQAVDPTDPDPGALGDRSVQGPGPPQRALHPGLALGRQVRPGLAAHADHPLLPGDRGSAPPTHGHGHGEAEEQHAAGDHDADHPWRDLDRIGHAAEQQDRAGQQRQRPADR